MSILIILGYSYIFKAFSSNYTGHRFLCEVPLYDKLWAVVSDNEKEKKENLDKLDINVYDLRSYGRVSLFFLNRKEK